MKTQVSTILRDVEIMLNEVNPNEAAFIGDTDHADLMTIIESQITHAIDQLHSTTQLSRMALDATEDINYHGDTTDPRFIYRRSTGVLTILMKSFSDGFDDTFDTDFLRLVTARSKAWPFDITNVIYPDDPLFAIVTDRYVGAQPDFPAVTCRKKQIEMDGTTHMVSVLELRCLETPSDWASVTYIPKAKIQDGQVNIDSKLYHDLINTLAEKVHNIIA